MQHCANVLADGPLILSVLQGRLEQIADDIDAILLRCAFILEIDERHDACHGLYHRETGASLVSGA